jgi:hypothetical protein
MVCWHVIIQVVFLPQMPLRTHAHDGAGTSRGGEDTPNPPPVPPTLVRLSLPWSTLPSTTRASCAKWQEINFSNTEEGVNLKDHETPPI